MKKTVAIFSTSHLPLVGGAQIAVDEVTRRIGDFNFVLFCPRLDKSLLKTEQINNVTIYRLGFGNSADKYFFAALGPLKALSIVGRRCIIWGVMANYGSIGALFYHYLTFKRNSFLLSLQEGATLEYLRNHAKGFFFLIKKIVRNATFLQPISAFLLEMAREMGFRSDQFKIIPNGVDLEKFSPIEGPDEMARLREKYRIDSGDKVLITASRLSEKNAIGDVVKAMNSLPSHYKFLIAGTGELQDDIRREIRESKLERRITLLGNCSHEEIIGLLSISHIFVRPSIREGLGSSFLEGMAMGVPIVATPVGGIKDFLVDGETGMVCRPRDVSSIAQAILRYEDAALYKKIQEAGRMMVERRFNWDGIAEEMREIFVRLK